MALPASPQSSVTSREVMAMLAVEGVTKSFGSVRALDQCTFSAAPKQLTGVLGPNGAGKTTVMRCLLGLVEPDEGRLCWRGAPVTERAWRRFGYMPEERGLYPAIAGREQTIHFGRLSGLTRAAARTQRRQSSTGPAWVNCRPPRRGALARQPAAGPAGRRLVHQPELLILDEPFAGLDPLGVTSLGSPRAWWVTGASLFPPTAPMFMPLRAAMTDVPAWQTALAVAFRIPGILALVRAGGRIDRGAVLRTSGRVRLRQAWHGG